MKESHLTKQIVQQLLTLTTLTIAILMAIGITIGHWRPGFAQVADWCSQPGILWCSSFEEKDGSNNDVFTYTLNLPTGNSTYAGQYGWYASPGGFVDRNDEQYNAGVDVVAGLPATITKVSTTIPARSGETDVKRYLWLNADTSFAITNINPITYPLEINKNAGVFLSRRTEGNGITFTTGFTQGLYYSSWYYFPTFYTSTTTANSNLMVMEFMVQSDDAPNDPYNATTWRRPWTIHLQGKTGNKMAFRVDEWSASLAKNPTSVQKNAVIQHNSSPLDIPINKWVHLEVFYKYAPYTGEEAMANSWRGKSNGGQVIVFQDGVEIYRFENVATAISTTETLISNHWIVTAYAHKSNPADFNFYVDDSAISTVRLGGGPREVLTNGDFANGSTPWRIDNNLSGTYSVDVNAGLVISNISDFKAGFVDITAPGPSLLKPTFYQTIPGGVLSGTAYTLRFSAKSDQNQISRATVQNNAYNCCGGDPSLPWTEHWNSNDFLLSPTLQNFVYVFTPTVTAPNVNLHLRAGLYTRKIWVDGVSLIKNDGLLLNGDFSVGTTGFPWKVNNSFGSLSITNTIFLSSTNNLPAAQIDVASGGNLSQPAFYQVLSGTVDPGVSYTLRFSARASINRTLRVAIQRTSDWTSIWWQDCGNVSLTQIAQNFVCTFTFSSTNAPEANPVLNFLLGNQTTANTVWIDNVSLARSQ